MEWMLLPLKRYADFQGRSRRMEFWMFGLGVFLLYIMLFVISLTIGIGSAGLALSGGGAGLVGLMMSMGVLSMVFAIVWLGLLIPSIAVSVRRLHDTGRSGFWLFLYLAPYLIGTIITFSAMPSNYTGLTAIGGIFSLIGLIGGIVLLVFYCLPGTVGPNRFGPDPLDPAGANVADVFS